MTGPLLAVLGGGQLGRMIALAGIPLGVRFRFLDPEPDCPASDLGELIVAGYDDEPALQRLARGAAAATVEFENVPASAARFLARQLDFFPGEQALATAQERLREKALFQALGIPTPRFAAVESRDGLERALDHCALPAVIKTRRLGYDGKGQFILRDTKEIDEAWHILGGVPLIAEQLVEFDRELSIIAVRDRDGHTAFYPLVENHHARGILQLSIAPAPGDIRHLQQLAEMHARAVLDRLSYVGVICIEFFQQGSTLIASEMACRVHNSGHWTIEGAHASQFENHVRAVLGMPLGSTEPRAPSVMLNLIGQLPDTRSILRIPGAHLHLYRKEPRPWRKLGHITISDIDHARRDSSLEAVRAIIDARPSATARS